MRLTPVKVRLTKTVRDMGGNVYRRGAVVEALFALDGIPEVLGAQYLPLSEDEWEPAIAEEDLARLLGDG